MTATKALAKHPERRMYERYDCEALIKWSYFNHERFFEAKIFNFSRDGFYFETSFAVKPKTYIFIRLETLFTKNMRLTKQECLRTVSISEVKWCHELSKDNLSYYGIGVKHCEVK